MRIRSSRRPAPSQFDRMHGVPTLNRRGGREGARPLQGGIDKIYWRGDGPLYAHELLRWLELPLTTALCARCIGE